jgi:hypothetical protein
VTISDDDPFGTEALRRATLQAWLSSPTRFREDANAEEDLVLGGYRDRWFVELAQNAADAAARAGVPGELRVSLHGRELRVANTGAALDSAGVAGLASLRASAKRDAASGSVGRFGVGFAGVLRVSAEPSVVSRTGGVCFSAEHTRRLVDEELGLHEELARRGGRVPVLRLVWPTAAHERPPDGFDTEVRLPLLDDMDPAALLADANAQAADLLLALPSLHAIDIAGAVHRRSMDDDEGLVVLDEPGGRTRWRVVRRHGPMPAELVDAAEERHRLEWSVCWAVPVSPSGEPRPISADVLHAPTPSDERLSLPARLLATLPVEPSRRRVRPGPALDHVLREAVRAYPALVRALPPTHRTDLVPRAGFPRSDLDATLRDAILDALRTTPWLPPALATLAELAPGQACVLDVVSPELVGLLAEVVPGLVTAELSGPAHAPALLALGIRRLTLADVVAAVSGLERPPGWWHELYRALAPLLDADPSAREELAALPVPLADGRTVTGPRTTILLDAGPAAVPSIPGLRIVHPDAVHPLLTRLGAQPSGPRELLDTPAVREAVERSVEDAEAGLDTRPLADLVLTLLTSTAGAPPWIGALALPDVNDEPRRADELVLPDGALRAVLAADSPIGILSEAIAHAHPRATLTAAGVLDGFAVLLDDGPTGPDHDLPGEHAWWRTLPEPPRRLVAVRDLDLVDPPSWPHALRLLATNPDTRRALLDPGGGYTRWWLAHHARLAGHPPRHWRLPNARDLAGLYDPVPVELDTNVLAAIGVRAGLTVDDLDGAADLLQRLADPERAPSPATARAAHAALAAAVLDAALDVDDLEPPSLARAVSGDVVPVEDAYVLDHPWLAGIADPDLAVAGGDPHALADLLDLPLASDVLGGEIASTGREVRWAALPEVAAACEALGRPVPPGTLTLHTPLRIRAADGTLHEVDHWVSNGHVHAADPVRALVWLSPSQLDPSQLGPSGLDPSQLGLSQLDPSGPDANA